MDMGVDWRKACPKQLPLDNGTTMWYFLCKKKIQVNKQEFSQIRQYLVKTQSQMAKLLGTSLKAVQSFEQEWRSVPVHIERQILFFWP